MTPQTSIAIDTPVAPPPWPVLQRELIRLQSKAYELLFDQYFDERGYLECAPRGGALDGPDDAIGNLANWPVLYLLGGEQRILEMCKHAQDAGARLDDSMRRYVNQPTSRFPWAR